MFPSTRCLLIVTVHVLIITAVCAIPLLPNGNGTPNVLPNATATVGANRANCGQVELDLFNIGATGQPSQDLFQYITFNGGLGTDPVSSTSYLITLPTPIFNGGIDLQIILSSLQGSFVNFSGQVSGPYTPVTDTITVQMNNGLPVVQNYNVAGNNFTFNSSNIPFLGNGTVLFLNNFTITFQEDYGTTPMASNSTCFIQYTFQVINPVLSNPTNSTATVRGDPSFIGLRGQSYQIHGIDGNVYNLISATSYQLNGRFTYLSGQRQCPIIPSTQRKSTTCWAHAGSYISELGLKTGSTQHMFIKSGPANSGFASITLNGKTISVGDSSDLFSYNSTHEISLTFGEWTVAVENSDMFLNLRSVQVNPQSWNGLASHGLLGQTWSNKRHSGTIPAIEGEVDDYTVMENSVFGDAFLFNKFAQ